MGSELKSQPTPPGSPTGPKYVEFVVFAVLAVVASAAIVVFLIKPANTAPVAEAGPVASGQEIPDANIITEGDKDESRSANSRRNDGSLPCTWHLRTAFACFSRGGEQLWVECHIPVDEHH